ncbi:MAG: cobalt ECF transporter T component CbiQ [Blautia sp.]|nr:cobalt ECF transporter T component CbiQ [Blautia sp.]
MSKINDAVSGIHNMDTLSSRDQWMNRIHPLVKFVITVFYIAVVVSFSKYDIIGLAAMSFYPAACFILGELSFGESIRRLRIVMPLVCMVGLFNPFFDTLPIRIGKLVVRAGVLSMITLVMKGFFSTLAAYILIATTSIEKICYALQLLHVPKILITQFLLTYRYITLFLQEVNRITQAYQLRAPGQRGIHYKTWGSLAGRMLLRSIDRANAVFESMSLRGYDGDFSYLKEKEPVKATDGIYALFWSCAIVLLRKLPVVWILGNWIGGFFA